MAHKLKEQTPDTYLLKINTILPTQALTNKSIIFVA